MPEFQPICAQLEGLRIFFVCYGSDVRCACLNGRNIGGSVFAVSYERASQMSHLHTDLVVASGVQLDLYE